MRVALEWFRAGSGRLRSEISSGLEKAGVAVAGQDEAVDSNAVVLVCGQPPVVADCTPCLLGAVRLVIILAAGVELPSRSKWALLEAGASDVLAWESAQRTVPRIVARLERWRHVDQLLESDIIHGNLAGASTAWMRVIRQVVEVARFGTNSVLITGETGTGKELVSRLIHALDPRRDKGDLVLVDCTTVVPTLSGSEFFGHERGAFTGAVSSRDGAFALANRGTLFLDEVGELPPTLQAELLRVLQEGTYKRVGGNEWKSTAFRLVCATNRDLKSQVATGVFRSDLFFRIAAASFHLPPLRERADDIPILAQKFITEIDTPATGFDPDVTQYLVERRYDGNVRELSQLVQRIAARHAGPGPISIGDVPPVDRPRETAVDANSGSDISSFIDEAVNRGHTLRRVREIVNDEMIRHTIDAEAQLGGKAISRRVAERLGVSERTVQTWRSSHPAAIAEIPP